MGGRRPKTSAERMAAGGGGHRPLPNDPTVKPGWPDLPAGLGAIGKREFRRLAGLMEEQARLTRSDGPALEGAARRYERWMIAHKRLRRAESARARKAAEQDAAILKIWLENLDGLETKERLAADSYRKWLIENCITAGTRARARVANDPNSDKPNTLSDLQKKAAFLRRPVGV